MPRLRRTETEKKDIALRQMIKNYQIERGQKSSKELAELMPCSRATIYSRLNDPGSFTVAELRRIKACLQIPTDKMLAYIGRAL